MRRRAAIRLALLVAGTTLFLLWPMPHLVPASATEVAQPPNWVDPFYAKYLDATGIAILGSANVDDRALLVARDTVVRMLAKRSDLAHRMAEQHAAVAVFAATEQMTDLPERRQYRGMVDKSGRSFDHGCGTGAVKTNPVTAICERTLLAPDAHFATLVHEFGHAIQNLGLDPETQAAIRGAFEMARQQGLFRRADGQPAFLMKSEGEFFADTSTMWFDGYNPSNPHNTPFVSTREQLRGYFPEIYRILAEIYPEDHWTPLW